jgi:release factor glutamine methyltransferase
MDNQTVYRSPFVALLENAISKKPHDILFDLAYEETLDALRQGGRFTLADLDLTIPAGVYPPRPGSSTEFFCRNWGAAGLGKVGGTLLEMGTGSGALALHAAKQGWDATGADIDEVAIRAAKHNAAHNGVKTRFVCSDLFAALAGERFDVILFNQPFYHKPQVRPDERALANSNGELTRRFLDQAADFLEPGGRLVFSYSNCSADHLLDRRDWSFQLVACDYESHGQYWRVLLVGEPA